MAESAKRAILTCQPFTMLRPDHYQQWKDIEITFDGEEADAASAMLIMALGAEKGAEVTVSGDDADAVAEIAALIEQDLDAD